MRLRGISTLNKFVYFGIEDGPVSINDKQTILMNRKDSPIIITKSIVRGTDDEKCFESDFIINRIGMMMVGFVVYTTRFCLWDIKREIITPLSELPRVYNTDNNTMYRMSDIMSKCSSLQFHYGSGCFRIKRVMYATKDNLWIDLKSTEGIPIDSISYCTGMTDENGENIYFGQEYKGGIVELYGKDSVVRYPDGSHKILEVC